MLQSLISGGSSSLIRPTRSLTPGIVVMSFIETTLPAACTPASVRAALPSLTFVGLSELSCDTAPTLMRASNNTPSMVRNFGSGWLA